MEALPIIGPSLWLIVKILFLVPMAVYLIFAVVIIKQVNLMVSTLEVGFEVPIKAIAWGHLLFALGTFILALIIL